MAKQRKEKDHVKLAHADLMAQPALYTTRFGQVIVAAPDHWEDKGKLWAYSPTSIYSVRAPIKRSSEERKDGRGKYRQVDLYNMEADVWHLRHLRAAPHLYRLRREYAIKGGGSIGGLSVL